METNIINKPKIANYEEKVMSFEKELAKVPGAVVGHEADKEFSPLKHTFVEGAYVREIFMRKGSVLTSKIHKIRHPYFVMKGKCQVITEEGMQTIEAPHHGITEPGTKRILKILEDTVWVTVHVTESKDLEEIENQIIARDFDCLEVSQRKPIKIKGDICLG